MTTSQRAAANCANAQLSTGPRTDEGKKRSSLNAFRHGPTGQIVIHTPENQAAFQKHCDAIRESLAPVSALETTLVQSIAEDYWRLNRGPSKTPSSPSASRSIPTSTVTQPRSRGRSRPRPHLDRTGPQPPVPDNLRTTHPSLRRKEHG